MSNNNDLPSDASSDQPSDDKKPASELSVDQLTQAFAQLIGQETPAGASAVDETADSPQESSPSDDHPTPEDRREEEDANVSAESILEAILFVGHPDNEPLTSRLMASYLRGVTPSEVDQLIENLNENYLASNSPYHVVSEGSGYRLSLRLENEGLRERFYGRVREAKLSQVAIDLLAIVAYNQPIDRESIEKFKGRPCGSVLSQLVRRELLEVERTQEKPRKTLYRTTERFLDLFRLDSLDDLPSHDDFHHA